MKTGSEVAGRLRFGDFGGDYGVEAGPDPLRDFYHDFLQVPGVLVQHDLIRVKVQAEFLHGDAEGEREDLAVELVGHDAVALPLADHLLEGVNSDGTAVFLGEDKEAERKHRLRPS